MTQVASPIKVPLYERINFRMIIFAAVLLFLIGSPLYLYFDSLFTGGIKNAGGGYLAVDLKSMGNFAFDGVNGTRDDVPRQWRDLDGKKLILEGQVWAPNEASDQIHRFELVYSIAKCCFGGPPKVQERVFCEVPNGGTVESDGGYSRVKGLLHVNVKHEGGAVTAVYELDVESVEPIQ